MQNSRVLACARQQGIEVKGLTFSSREVQPGFVFFALKGAHVDGNLFIEDAIKAGASVIVSAYAPAKKYPVLFIQSADIDTDMADAAYEFYGRPSDLLKMYGITGTKGKTSIAYLLESIFRTSGEKTGVFGTVNYRIGARKICDAPNTTPAALTLFKLLAEMKKENCTRVVMEVSSHSLALRRVHHIWYDGAVFTNLQRDHLDFHQTFENYFQTKRKLFINLADPNNPKQNRTAVINTDDSYGVRLAQELKNTPVRTVTFGLDHPADLQAQHVREFLTHTTFTVQGIPVKINLLGRHNVYNALAAWAVAQAGGISTEQIVAGLAALPGVPGRMERIDEGQDFFVFVDFAYTNESLQRAFATVKPFAKGKIFVVFGCGGDRDRTKRPLMGRTACEQADFVFLTNDNPRTESPDQIFKDIVAGMDGFSNYEICPDRAQAIGRALAGAQAGDIVIVAGKGHENYQLIGKEKKHFSDQETVRHFLRGELHV